MTFSYSIPNGATFVKDLSMFSLERDEIVALWPNDSLTSAFYVIFSKIIPNLTTFEKEYFWFDAYLKSDKMTAIWPNDS